MSENNLKVLSFIAIIIGASGLGFGTYSILQIQSGAVKGDDGDDGDDGTDGTISREYYKKSSTAAYSNPTGEDLPINTLNITFNIYSGESAYFHYTGEGIIYGISYISVVFVLDGNIIQNIGASFSLGDANPMLYSRSSLSMQFLNNTLSGGTHEITISRSGSHSNNYVESNVLYVQISKS